MEEKREHAGRYPIGKYDVLNHYLDNLVKRVENRDDVLGLTKVLVELMPDYADTIPAIKLDSEENE